jgi:hypothetical protein
METAKQPIWPLRTFEKVLTPVVILAGHLVFAFLFSAIRLLFLICFVEGSGYNSDASAPCQPLAPQLIFDKVIMRPFGRFTA